MDRQIVYPGQILPETSLLQMAKDSMIGTAKLASAILGTSTYASGFAVTPTGPASLQVVYAPGEIYSLTSIDALAFSTLPADTTHSILKQGILLDGGTLNCPAPGTTGQSINYLVQVTYQDSDSAPVLLPYYNSANPALPYSGVGNNGLTQNTVRKGIAVVSVKAGASATTGTQVTPAPDAGYIGLYVVTVAFGQTTITGGNISLAASAPIINSSVHGLTPTFAVPVTVGAATQSQHAMQLGQAVGRLIGVQVFNTAGTFTYTPTAGTSSVVAEVQGGGAGSGGVPASIASGAGFSPSGGSGAYGRGRYTSAFSGITVTVGAAGAAGAAGGNSGGAGGTSSFGALLSAPGGNAGPGGNSTTTFPNNSGFAIATSAPSGANIEGAPGAPGSQVLMASFNYGTGFNAPTLSRFGAGAGAGGAGTYIGQSIAATAGKAGQPGTVIVWEYA